jgi:hypothetical protein
MAEEKFSPEQSLQIIQSMINKAKNSYNETGIGAMMWGAVIAVCSLEKFSEIQFNFQLPFDIYYLTIIAVIPQVFIVIREKKQRRVKSYDDVFLDNIWFSFGISIFLLILVINTIAANWNPVAEQFQKLTGQEPTFHLYEYISSLFLILYGIPTFVTGISMRFKPMFWGGILCWACSVIAVYTNVKADLLLTGTSAIVAWLIPGLIMQKQHRLAKKEVPEAQHV